jgi:putative heme iron utilization protein
MTFYFTYTCFGDINWISKEVWTLPAPDWLDSEENIVQHMNEDHENAMQLICQHLFGIEAKHVVMLTLTPDGCFLSADQSKPLFIPFAELVHNSFEVRQQLVKITHAARQALLT